MDTGIAAINERIEEASAFAYRLREEIGALRLRSDLGPSELGGVLEGFATDLAELDKK